MGGAAIRAAIATYLAPLLRGADPRDVERLWHRCTSELHAVGIGGLTSLAVSAVDIALWDAIGKCLDRPLFRLFGGSRDEVPAYASALNLHLEGAELADQVARFVDEGYRAVKIKVGRPEIGDDVERVATAREAVGPGVELMLDANQVWRAGDAVRRISRLERFDPAWIEEPIHALDLAGNARVRASVRTPVASGESLYTRHPFAQYAAAGAVDVVQADVARVGGYTEWLKIAALASAHHLEMAPHYMPELSLHALCGIHNGRILEDIEGGTLTELGLLAEPIRVERGVARPSDAPGHGVVFDEEALTRHRVGDDFEVTSARR